MYCLVLKLADEDGAREGVEACQVAFRHTCIVGGRMLHNGRPIMIRGVNRHEHDPNSGKVWRPLCHVRSGSTTGTPPREVASQW